MWLPRYGLILLLLLLTPLISRAPENVPIAEWGPSISFDLLEDTTDMWNSVSCSLILDYDGFPEVKATELM